MPHFQIDYSGNLEAIVDLSGLCERIRATAADLETFPMPGIRVRAVRVDHYAIADGDPKHGFIDISIRLRAGRAADVKADATAKIFEAAKDYLAPIMQTHSIALSLEMRDIDPGLSLKTGTIRDHLEAHS
ncbi:5-carboxymethyl-2-hydroxymuconate isomerase [Sulfitobacter sp. SK012]|uniref:5-carboxymethyl-2-hydroxymuconate Delta-isomerase n=1 Tax=Sulfitobacter sp. SK012 TaxID=1389005 RepID=UPI000E0BC345|nr:5-carboxymethyl-2-hydroxymuconate Delta-isomerase [Sulfitobacter sp. SK012]AXI46584.1 5-carboxymethyl-2-hydroxymuconate isomerase [Sulfitobacter sp. SK012]